MDHNEARAIRRDWINYHLHIGMTVLSRIKWNVRHNERGIYGFELSAYKGFQS